MKRLILILVMAVGSGMAYGQGNLAPYAAYCMYATNWIPVASSAGPSAPESYPQIALFGLNGTTWYPLACDSSGNLVGGGFANPMTTLGDMIYENSISEAARLAGPTSGAGTYLLEDVTTGSTATAETWSAAATGSGAPVLANSPTFVGTVTIPTLTLTNPLAIGYQTTNPSTTLHVNSASAYGGTPDGTEQKPFTTLLDALADMTQSAAYTVIFDQGGSYSLTSGTFPPFPTALEIYCNGASVAISGMQTIPVPLIQHNCYFSGSAEGTATSAPSILYGGNVSGDFTIGSGTVTYYGTTISGATTITIAAGGTVYAHHVNWSGQIVSGGAGALLVVDGQSTLTAGGFSSNLNFNAGGRFEILDGTTLTNSGVSPNIAGQDGASSSAPNIIGDNVSMNKGMQCGSAYCAISNSAVVPSIYSGTNTYYAGLNGTLPASFTTLAASGQITSTANGALSMPSVLISGVPVTGGTGTTTFPLVYIDSTGATAPTVFSTAGTMFGVNAPSGFTGYLLDLFTNGSPKFYVDYQGNGVFAFAVTAANFSATGVISSSAADTISNSVLKLTGALYTGGTGTSTQPYIYHNVGTAPSTWSTTGTVFGANEASGFTGNFVDYHLNGGGSLYSLDYQGNQINAGALTSTKTIPTSATAGGVINIGTPNYTDTGMVAAFQGSTNSYIYNLIQNTNTGTTASACYLAANANTTSTTYYGEFCMNGSGYTGTGALNQANTTTFDSVSTDIAIGTYTANALHFVYNNGSTDSMTINGSGVTFNVLPHYASTAPTASAGSVATYSTNVGGEITSLSGATTVTITFANSGWTNAAFCTAVDSQAATPVANTSQSNTSVTFTFSSLTGNLFYQCSGN